MTNMEMFENREVSWLSFNHRVLQEAMDETNPLIERIRFLGIFSNNRDEFFRVRIASVNRMTTLGKKARRQLYDDPDELVERLREIVIGQEKQFLRAYKRIVNEAKEQGIFIVNNKELSDSQRVFVLDYFKEKVRSALVPIMLHKRSTPDLTDKSSYLAVKMTLEGESGKAKYALIRIPSNSISRFLVLPEENGKQYVMFLDDVIRLGLSQIFKIFPYEKIEAYAVKMTRDAELDIDDDLDESIMEKLSKSISRRKKAKPVRFVHDAKIPEDLLNFLLQSLKISDRRNVISSGKYHNLKDLISFPNLIGKKPLTYEEQQPSRHPALSNKRSLLDEIERKDVLLHYPYQTFSHTIDILREAAIDPTVTEIQINIYRAAHGSKIINALINASANGKKVTAVIELRARFDEEHNMELSRKLQEKGVKVIFGVEGLKVHCKLISITRKVRNKHVYFAHIGTGNFHEGTAKFYTDVSLWTANQKIAKEIHKLFTFFKKNYERGVYRELVVSPFNVRRKMYQLIDQEAKNAQAGKKASIIIKLNNLVDNDMIMRLYKAGQAGVKIQLIIRGICALRPGVKGLSENIEVISILGRYLEHSRIIIFENGGDELIFISSADWMRRNLDHRIEIATPIHDPEIKQEIRDMIDIMLKDNTKARIIDQDQQNGYKVRKGKAVQAQKAIFEYYQNKMLNSAQ